MAEVYPWVDEWAAHLGPVRAELRKEARVIAARAKGLLAAHRDTGAAKIRVKRGVLDYHVILDDPAALSIEFGHFQKSPITGEVSGYVQGLYILTRAVG